MREKLRALNQHGLTPSAVIEEATNLIAKTHTETPEVPIAYVSGKVTADGVAAIAENLQAMKMFTDKVAELEPWIIVFSAEDIFPDAQYWVDTLLHSDHKAEFYEDWAKILESAITDIYMMPGWEKSKGASFEYEKAQTRGLNIHL